MNSIRKASRLPWFEFRNEYFLFLLPLFFVLHGFIKHIQQILIRDAVLLFVEYLAWVLILLLIFWWLFQSFRKAAIFCFFVFVFYFFFGPLQDFVEATVPGTILSQYRYTIPVSLIIFAVLFSYIFRAKSKFNRLVLYLNSLFAILLAIEIFDMAFKKSSYDEVVDYATINSEVLKDFSPCDTCTKEDIHLIILDEYAGSKELREVLGFNNSGFEQALLSRGFHIVENSVSNYNFTVVSTASLFSLNYLNRKKDIDSTEFSDIGHSVMKKNVFMDILTKQGYEIENYSVFDVSGSPAFHDYFYPGIDRLTGQTFLSRIFNDLGFHLVSTLKLDFAIRKAAHAFEQMAEQNRKVMQGVIKEIEKGRTGKPRFTYSHLMMPHEPYIYDKDGKFIAPQYYMFPSKDRDTFKTYVEYLQYTNHSVLAFIDTILKRSQTPPVIILMSDHGFRDRAIKKNYHFMTLNAVFYPDGRYNGYYRGMSNVNQFRVLLNNRFHQKLPLLSDSSIFLGWEGIE